MAIGIGLLLLELEYGIRAWHVITVQAAALALVSAVAIWRYVAPAPSAPFPKAMLRPQHGYLLGYFIVLALFSQVDIFMLKALADADTLASYASAARYYQLLSLALGAVHAVILPSMQAADSSPALDDLFRKHSWLLAAFAPVVAACAVLATWVLPWVDLGRYPDSVPTFQILCVSAVVSFAFSPHVNLVFTQRRFRFLFLLIVSALAINMALNAALIPLMGERGAAIATLVGSACVTIPIFVLSRQLRRAGTMVRA
jgi:O-antigen/teichoic acid export membrane protein